MNASPKSPIVIAAVIALFSANALGQSANSLGPPGGLNVNVTNAPNVTVVNSASAPVPVAVTNRSPIVVKSVQVPYSVDSVGSCNDVNCFIYFPAVPGGKMLVIEHVSAYARPSGGAIFDFAELVGSNTENPAIGTRFIFPMARIGLAGSSVVADTYGVNAPVLAFVREGQQPRLTLATHVAGPILFSQGTISGYMIDAPQ